MKDLGYISNEDYLFKLPKNGKELEESMKKLVEHKYFSAYAEKRRWYSLRNKMEVFFEKDERNDKFISLIKSYLSSINEGKKVDWNKIINDVYFVSPKGRAHKALYDNEKHSFSCNYVENDTIYTDSFDLITKRSGKQVLLTKRTICAPFTLEIWSFRAIKAKIIFKRSFKYYVESIEGGLT